MEPSNRLLNSLSEASPHITDVEVPSQISDLYMEVDSCPTDSLVVNGSDVITTQNTSHISNPSTNSEFVAHEENKFVHLLSFNQTLESEESESTTEASYNPSYVLSQLFAYECSYPVLSAVSARWISAYYSHINEAMSSLVELILHSAGCNSVFSKDFVLHLLDMSTENIHRWITPNLAGIKVDPHIWNDNYIENTSRFIGMILQAQVLLNIGFMMKVVHLLEGMVKCGWSSARFTATIFGCLIVQRYNKLYSKQDVPPRDPLNPSTNLADLQTGEVICNAVENVLHVILLCLRDVDVTIRKFMFEVFIKWMGEWPVFFVNDKYLCHVRLGIFDDSPQIRALVVQKISWLVMEHKSGGKLELFIEKTIPHVFDRVMDVSSAVAVKAIQAITDLWRALPEEKMLKYGSPENIYLHILKSEGSLASEAALFLYSSPVLAKYHADPKMFIRELLDFLIEAGKTTKQGNLECKLASSMFKHAQNQLTHWPAWRHLLLENSMMSKKDVQEVACRLLIATVCQSTGNTNYSPFPEIVDDEVKSETVKEKKAKVQHELNKLELTKQLAPHMLELWEEYKNNLNCLIPLIKIPQHFSKKAENVDLKKLIIGLLVLEKTVKLNNVGLDDTLRSLSAMRYLMSNSERWKKDIVHIEKKCFFEPVVKNFLDACQKIDTAPKESKDAIDSKRLLKYTIFLSKHFDMTSTEIPDIALKAFQYGSAKLNSQIICAASMTCLNIVKWEVKNIAENKYAKDEWSKKLYNLSSLINTMYKMLSSLIMANNPNIVDTAYTVMTTLLAIFSPVNNYVRPHTVLHLPEPTLVESEWLSYYLSPKKHWDRSSRDASWFTTSQQAVHQFCTLVIIGVLDVTYMSTLLPYFAFHNLKKNYNSSLEDLGKSAQFPGFSDHLCSAMTSLLRSHNLVTLENIASGVCFVIISKVKPKNMMHNLATQVVWAGLEYITDHKDFTLFVMLAPFVKHMSQNQVTRLMSIVNQAFHLHLDNPCIKRMVDALEQHIKQCKGREKLAGSSFVEEINESSALLNDSE